MIGFGLLTPSYVFGSLNREEAPEWRPFHVKARPAALMQPAEEPDEKDDRNRDSEQPQQ
jgi:hypothetical protein